MLIQDDHGLQLGGFVLMAPAYTDHNVPAGPPPVINDRKSIGHGRGDCAPVTAISSIAAAR